MRSFEGEHCSATPHVRVRRVQVGGTGYGTCTTDRLEFMLKLRRSPVSRRAPTRRLSLSATAVNAQLRSITSGCDADSSAIEDQNVPILENIQYQNAMIRQVPPHAAT